MIESIYFQSKGAEEFRFLSNFWLSPIIVPVPQLNRGEIAFATVEHYYQAMKTEQADEVEAIVRASTPREAKDLGGKVSLIANWDEPSMAGLLYKDTVMLAGLRAKFLQHADLRAQLLGTRNRHLVEYAPWGDTYWGVDRNYAGRNMLGTLLMLVRATLGREMKK